MVSRKDSIEDANKRLVNDKIAFNEANLQGISFVVDSGNKSLQELCDIVINLYNGVLKNL